MCIRDRCLVYYGPKLYYFVFSNVGRSANVDYVLVFAQLVSTDGSSVSDSKSQGAADSVHDMDVTAEKTPVQQTSTFNASAR